MIVLSLLLPFFLIEESTGSSALPASDILGISFLDQRQSSAASSSTTAITSLSSSAAIANDLPPISSQEGHEGEARALFYRVGPEYLAQWIAGGDQAPDREEEPPYGGEGVGVPIGASDDASVPVLREEGAVQRLCNLTATEYGDSVSATVVSKIEDLGFDTGYWTVSTYPQRALIWLADQDPLVQCPSSSAQMPLLQRFLMVLLFFQLNGPSWMERSGWLTGSSECGWYGVECDESNQRVTAVILKRNGLSGRFPPQILVLPALRQLSLDHNAIVGTLPHSLASATSLEVLELDDNQMNGTLPSELYSLARLRALDLNSNGFSGTLSDQIQNLSKLMVLQLEHNQLAGSLPASALQQLEDLVLLTLHDNLWSEGSSLELLCDSVEARRTTNPAYVQFLSLDCATSVCSCCSQCF